MEILVSVALIGVVMLGSSLVVLQVVRQNQLSSLMNEATQNVTRLMDEIGSNLRLSGCSRFNDSGKILSMYPQNCSDVPFVSYIFNANGTVQKLVGSNSTQLIPPHLGICRCNGCGNTGVVITPSDTNVSRVSSMQITLSARPTQSSYGTDSCVTLVDSFVPRN